jgi:methionyl-tRNA formyltransferase
VSGGVSADRSGTVPAPRYAADGPVRTVFFGSGSFAVPILEALASLPGIEIVAVVSAPDRPVGRKAILTSTPVASRAAALWLPLHQPARVRAPESVASLGAMRPDLCVLADYGQLIPRSLIELPPRGFLNLHPSALPRHRGATPVPATILAGDATSAVTLLCLTEELDAGPIVAAVPLDVRPDDTTPALEERAAEVAAGLLVRALPEWLIGQIRPQAQTGDVTLTKPLRREDGRLDPARSAVDLERQVRAYQPWPGSFLERPSGRLIVWRVRVARGGEAATAPGADAAPGATTAAGAPAPGTLFRHGDSLALATGSGTLLLDEVQLPGGRRMAADALLRGNPAITGGDA